MSVLILSSRNQSHSSYGNQGPLMLGLSLAEFVVATSLVGLRVYYVISKRIPRAGWSLYWTSASWVGLFPLKGADPFCSDRRLVFRAAFSDISHHFSSLRHRKPHHRPRGKSYPYQCFEVGLDRATYCAVCHWPGEDRRCYLFALSARSHVQEEAFFLDISRCGECE